VRAHELALLNRCLKQVPEHGEPLLRGKRRYRRLVEVNEDPLTRRAPPEAVKVELHGYRTIAQAPDGFSRTTT
jgi:hypothetical protein